MKQVFADTLYLIAIFLPGDPWASTARTVDLSGTSLVTTEEVLSEFSHGRLRAGRTDQALGLPACP